MTANTVSRPAEPQRPAQTPHHGKAPGEKPAESDLFASLLNLVSDTHLTPEAATLPTDQAATDTQAPDPKDENPLAALLAWAAPASTTAATATPTGPNAAAASAQPGTTTGPALPAGHTPEANGVDITGMTPVADETLATTDLPATAAPASAPARPAFATPAARPAFASRIETLAQSGTPAMVWQRGAPSSTDALQQQFASQTLQHAHGAPLASVRSTVALDERFALAGAGALQASAARESGFELPLPGNGGASVRTATPDAASGLGSPTLADGSAAGNSAGGSSGDALPGEQAGQTQDGMHADREADGPTVSHWGTQHLRHASLRVGESGADAIDIQLSMKGQEVQVAFQSDNAEARASLREGASDALTEMLQRSGIQLGNVSVGAQGHSQRDASGHTPTVSRGEVAGRAESAAAPPTASAPRPRADGSQPLDLFV